MATARSYPTPHTAREPGGLRDPQRGARRTPDVGCVLHLHTTAGLAVSCQASGLLPLTQPSTVALAALGYHDYEGIALHDDEKPRLQRDLGSNMALGGELAWPGLLRKLDRLDDSYRQ